MNKKLENLVNKFKSVEGEIVELLNESPINFDESQEKSVVKKQIKEYIKRVNKAKKLFSQYEELAKEIEEINSDEGDSAELAKAVLDIRDLEKMDVFAQAYGTETDVTLEKLKKKDEKKIEKTKENKKTKEAVKTF